MMPPREHWEQVARTFWRGLLLALVVGITFGRCTAGCF